MPTPLPIDPTSSFNIGLQSATAPIQGMMDRAKVEGQMGQAGLAQAETQNIVQNIAQKQRDAEIIRQVGASPNEKGTGTVTNKGLSENPYSPYVQALAAGGGSPDTVAKYRQYGLDWDNQQLKQRQQESTEEHQLFSEANATNNPETAAKMINSNPKVVAKYGTFTVKDFEKKKIVGSPKMGYWDISHEGDPVEVIPPGEGSEPTGVDATYLRGIEKKLMAKGMSKDDAQLAAAEQVRAENLAASKQKIQFGVTVRGAEQDKKEKKVSKRAEQIAEGIESGRQPPEVQGFGMAKYAGEVRGILEEHKFDLTTANADWLAVKKHVQTMNSTQQLRLGQAISFTRESLPIIRSLATEWKSIQKTDGSLVPLNNVELKLAENGAYGKKAASIATRLNAQISDLSSELGTVYKGGNSSTDESLKLAASNLKGKWDETVLSDNIDQVEKNLTIRENSMKHSGVAALSKGSIYAPKPPAGQPVPPPSVKTGPKQGDVVKGYKFNGGDPANKNSWTKVQ